MKNLITYIFLFFSGILICNAQNSLSELLKKHNSESIPYISVQELAMPKTEVILLDARETEEYNVSHLEDAIHIGYDDFDINSVTKQIKDKSAVIVVYCSLGVRSEDIGEQLKKAGYTNIFNLYGGIFEWKNKGYSVYNSEEKLTEDVHAFSKTWSKWLLKGNKIYD